MSADALSAFSKIKAALTKTTELSYVLPDVELCLPVRLELGQFYNKRFLGLGNLFRFSPKRANTQKRYSTFGRELSAAKAGIRHSRDFLEGETILYFHLPYTGLIRRTIPQDT